MSHIVYLGTQESGIIIIINLLWLRRSVTFMSLARTNHTIVYKSPVTQIVVPVPRAVRLCNTLSSAQNSTLTLFQTGIQKVQLSLQPIQKGCKTILAAMFLICTLLHTPGECYHSGHDS